MPQEQQPSFVDLPYVGPTMPLDPVSTLNKDVGGPGSFSELLVGAGAKAFHADSSGWWQGAVKFADAPARCDMSGNAVFNSILINGRDGATIAGAIDANGNFIHEIISTNLNTQTKQILGSFTFGSSGAIAIATDASNGLWLSPTGLLGKKAGATTFAIDTGGNATFGGALVAASGTLGTITAGTLNGVALIMSSNPAVAGFYIDSTAMYHIIQGAGFPFGVSFANGSAIGDIGDVKIGYGSKYIFWDQSAGSLTVRGSLNADDITAGTMVGLTVESNSSSYRIMLDATNRRLAILDGATLRGSLHCDGDGDLKIYSTDDLVFNVASGCQYRFRINDTAQNLIDADGDFQPATNNNKVGASSFAFTEMNSYSYVDKCLWLDNEDDLAILKATAPKKDRKGNMILDEKTGKPKLDPHSLPDWIHNEKSIRDEIAWKIPVLKSQVSKLESAMEDNKLSKIERKDLETQKKNAEEDLARYDLSEKEIIERTGRNLGHFVDLIAGSVRKLDERLAAIEQKNSQSGKS